MSQQGPVKPMISVSGKKRSGSTTDEKTPTTPRSTARFTDHMIRDTISEESTSSTPTRKNFAQAHGQRPLPSKPFPSSDVVDAPSETPPTLSREESRLSVHSHHSNESEDVDMMDDEEGLDAQEHSETESVNSDSERPSKKKKKGQRFYCTDFPPCQLSFTRSEHLARHIRKHTGERPFQCHCSRRFSRLDNLRQHAQTVHVNEDIPGDSLAATGTRFQRQIRTDRVRPPNTRPRASTASSQGGHSRGHSRNLSASSITSTASNVSMLDDVRPRPAPLNLSQDGHARLSLETFNPAIGNAGTQYGIFQQSPSGFSTPTSATFSAGASSPQFSSGMPSPSSTLSRSSFYNGTRTPARRLSVPSGVGPYQTPNYGSNYPPPYFSPMQSTTAPNLQNAGGMLASPTGPLFPSHGRRDSDADLEWRRRTWHPGTQTNYVPRPATSGLSYHQTPDDAVPALSSQPAASQITRLPGIESFDHAPPPPTAPQRTVTSPTLAAHSRSLSYSSVGEGAYANAYANDRRHPSDAGINLTKLDIGTPGPRASWTEQTRMFANSRPITAPHSGYSSQQGHQMISASLQPPAEIRLGQDEAPMGERERSNKRQAWYGGPIAASVPQGSQPIMIAHRTSPESSSSDGVPTPSTSHGREMHPAIRHANGLVEMQPPGSVLTEEQQRMMQAHYNNSKPEPIRADSGFHSYVNAHGQITPTYTLHSGHDMHMNHGFMQAPPRPNNDMGRLEALVAVATSENRAVEHGS